MEMGNRGLSDGTRPKRGNAMKCAEIPLKCIATQAHSHSDEFIQRPTVCPQHDTVPQRALQRLPFCATMISQRGSRNQPAGTLLPAQGAYHNSRPSVWPAKAQGFQESYQLEPACQNWQEQED
jgi:hypothetical protein